MGIDVSWFDEEKNAIYWRFDAEWSLDDYHQAVNKMGKMAQDISIYNVICDLSRVHTAPPNAIANIQSRHVQDPGNYGVTIAFGADRFLEIMLSILSRLPVSKEKYVVVGSLEEAVKLHRVRIEEFNAKNS